MVAAIQLTIRILDIVFGVIGLLLILRVLLQVFGMRRDHPILRVLFPVTDPVLSVTNQILGIPSYRSSYNSYRAPRSDLLSSMAALVLLWGVRALIVWALGLVIQVPLWLANPLGSLHGILVYVITILFDFYAFALFVRVLFSWIRVPYTGWLMRFLWDITEPLLAPIRSALPLLGGIDLSPLIAFFILRLLEQVIFTLLSWIF